MGLESLIINFARPLTGFHGSTSIVVGTIVLDVYSPPVISAQSFMIIKTTSPYNGILDQPWLSKINAVSSSKHEKIRYPIFGVNIGQINSDQAMSKRCSAQGLKSSKGAEFIPITSAEEKGKGLATFQYQRLPN